MNERIGYPDFIKIPAKLNAKYSDVSVLNRHNMWLGGTGE
jgi:hypothetical protein